MTTMAKILGKEISREQLLEVVRSHFMRIFERDWQRKRLEEII
jgi:hypothetical protein